MGLSLEANPPLMYWALVASCPTRKVWVPTAAASVAVAVRMESSLLAVVLAFQADLLVMASTEVRNSLSMELTL